MRKTKFMVIGFAFLASILIIMTSCLARPVQEKTVVDIVEKTQEAFIDALGDYEWVPFRLLAIIGIILSTIMRIIAWIIIHSPNQNIF